MKDIQSEQSQTKDTNQLGSQIVREIVIPELTKEVNENKNFAQLRQVYNSLILATWYKKKIKDSILEQVYADKNKVAGVNIDDPKEKEKIYQRYLQAFKKGVYNYIKEEVDPITQEMIPRKYFSGGVDFGGGNTSLGIDHAMTNATAEQAEHNIEQSRPVLDVSAQLDQAQVNPVMLDKMKRAVKNAMLKAVLNTVKMEDFSKITPADITMPGQREPMLPQQYRDDIETILFLVFPRCYQWFKGWYSAYLASRKKRLTHIGKGRCKEKDRRIHGEFLSKKGVS